MIGSPSLLRQLELWRWCWTWRTHGAKNRGRGFEAMLLLLRDIAVAYEDLLAREEKTERLQFQDCIRQATEKEVR